MHIAGGLPAVILPYIHIWVAVIGAAAGVAVTYMIRPQLTHWLRHVSKPKDRARGVITGFRGFSHAVLALIILWVILEQFTGNARYYCMFGWLALAFGDGLAGLVGPSPRKAPTVPWNRDKTYWGAFGCFIGSAAAYAWSFWMPWAGGITGGAGAGAILITAAAVTIIESLPLPVDDNYTVGIGAALCALLVHALNGGIV